MGYGAIVLAPDGPRLLAAGVLRARARDAAHLRIGQLGEAFEGVLNQTRPTTIVIENAFSHRNPRTAIRLGEARGMLIAAAYRRTVPVVEISPADAKKRITGNGRAAKEQVAAMVPRLLGLSEALALAEDATDALALALAFARRRELGDLLSR